MKGTREKNGRKIDMTSFHVLIPSHFFLDIVLKIENVHFKLKN